MRLLSLTADGPHFPVLSSEDFLDDVRRVLARPQRLLRKKPGHQQCGMVRRYLSLAHAVTELMMRSHISTGPAGAYFSNISPCEPLQIFVVLVCSFADARPSRGQVSRSPRFPLFQPSSGHWEANREQDHPRPIGGYEAASGCSLWAQCRSDPPFAGQASGRGGRHSRTRSGIKRPRIVSRTFRLRFRSHSMRLVRSQANSWSETVEERIDP